MKTKCYPSDLTDAEWQMLKVRVPIETEFGRPRKIDLRKVWDAIFYLVRSGCSWRMLPHDFPKWETVYYYFSKWKKQGAIEDVHDIIRREVRVEAGKEEEPSLGIIDSQSVKTTEKGGSKVMTAEKK